MSKIKRSSFEDGVNLIPSPEEEILKAMKECSRIAAENGISDMTLSEINEEIGKTRAHFRTRVRRIKGKSIYKRKESIFNVVKTLYW